ncbi:MAG TPA: hypothetical protein VFI69_03715, partial [Candidatus Limnocylindrales bacterium]|nr:hypothetical protein [Candidatus Limnocylindrales bacterium]
MSGTAPTHRVFVADAGDIPPPRDGLTVVVLDPAWTPLPGDRPDVVASRRLLGAVTGVRDVFDVALERLDAWADATGIADRLIVEDVTLWFRLRETMWRWLHERSLWRYALEELGATADGATFTVPAEEAALIDVAARIGEVEVVGGTAVETARPMTAGAPPRSIERRSIGRLIRRFRPSPARTAPVARDGRPSAMDERAAAMASDPTPRIVVLTTPATYQRVAAADDRPRDPILGSVVAALEVAGFAVTLFAMGLDDGRQDDRSILEGDERMLPQSLLRTRWSGAEDGARVERALADVGSAFDALGVRSFDVGGVDLGEAFLAELRTATDHVVTIDVRQRARVERLLAELRPVAVVLAQEGIRVPWLTAGQAAGVPVFAVQHGILYPGHPGYPHRRHRAVARARRTFVYGSYERDMLLARGAYLDDEVEVSGSPRLDLDERPGSGANDAGDAAHGADRLAVRRQLGVRDGDRLLVVSTVHVPFVQRAHLAPTLERLLGGPLPGVHVAFKQHPGERTDGPHRDLLIGLAAAGGYDPPPISVVRDIDLYRLLRAADAHLGLHSTVLTDAVAAGTPNLIALTDA